MSSTKYQVTKRRDYLTKGWIVDVFQDDLFGLSLLEKEFKTIEAAHKVKLPEWAKRVTEVTDTVSSGQLARIAASLRESSDLEGESIAETLLKPALPRIVLTGAPCSGKSSAIKQLKEDKTLHCVPETATIIMEQVGIRHTIGQLNLQSAIRNVQGAFEVAAIKQAQRDNKAAVILDRGTLDSAAFMGGLGAYEQLLTANRDEEFARYSAVIMLGLPCRETWELNHNNNPIRRETFDEAVAIQAALVEVWSDHPNFIQLGDFPTWEQKYDVLRNKIDECVDSLAPLSLLTRAQS